MLITKILGLFYFNLSRPFEGVQGWENPFTLWLLTQGWLHFRWNFSSPWYTHRGTLHRLSDGASNDRTNVGPLPRLWYPAPLDCAPTVKKHIHVNKTDRNHYIVQLPITASSNWPITIDERHSSSTANNTTERLNKQFQRTTSSTLEPVHDFRSSFRDVKLSWWRTTTIQN